MTAIVDAHTHVSLHWFEPVETLLYEMDRNGVERAVLTQILNEPDNSYQQECVREHPERFASIVGVDPSRPEAPSSLAALADEGARGVRLRATDRSPGPDPYEIWRSAAGLSLTVSCAGSARDFADPAFAELVEELAQLRIVLEHLGASSHPDADADEAAARRAAFALSRYPNVSIKVHGVGEIARRALPVSEQIFEARTPSLLLEAHAAYGAARMMWGSDFPPVASREGYANALEGPRRVFETLEKTEQELIFGGTALAAFF